jgi:ABC-2 type transport system ATP-binding protein
LAQKGRQIALFPLVLEKPIAVLSIQNVSKAYQNHVALRGVSLEAHAGQIFGLLGPNGAGKTTLIRIINRITGPDSGTVLFNDRPLREESLHQVGYLPEERGLYKKMKVGEQALYLCQLRGMDTATARKTLREWFERLEMTAWWDKKVEELSKGMAQKVQFVTTVAHKPKLLIFDEPFTGFDPVNTELIKREMLRLKAEGATILLSTHRMESVEELCDRIGLIHRSEKVLEGPTRQIRMQHRTNRFKALLEEAHEAPLLQAGYTVHADEHQHLEVSGNLDNNPREVLQNLSNAGRVLSFEEVIPTMNDIFIQLVKGNSHE